MKKSLVALFGLILIVSCSKNENLEVKKVSKMKAENSLSGVVVVNELDPVCEMATKDYLKDTVVYNKQVYGFCSDHCKAEFKKNPEKFSDNLK